MNILWSLFIFCFGLLSGALIWQNYENKASIVIEEKTEIQNVIYSFNKNNQNLSIQLFKDNSNFPEFQIKYLNNEEDEKLKQKVIRLLELFSETNIELNRESDNNKKDNLKLKITSNNTELVYFINREVVSKNIAIKNFLKLFQIYSTNS